jgi:2-oxoglutarate dehydrogenase E2 component (dihydrolipoamide succinyltransferase)
VELCAKEGDTVQVGSDLFKIDTGASNEGPNSSEKPVNDKGESGESEKSKTIVNAKAKEKDSGRQKLNKEPSKTEKKEEKLDSPKQDTRASNENKTRGQNTSHGRPETREKMTRMRQRIAERMKEAQNTAATLTTFNEADMSEIVAIRNKHKEAFFKEHGVKLGYMSMFIRACSIALQEIPVVNSRMDQETQEIVYPEYVDISVAVATPKVSKYPIDQ